MPYLYTRCVRCLCKPTILYPGHTGLIISQVANVFVGAKRRVQLLGPEYKIAVCLQRQQTDRVE